MTRATVRSGDAGLSYTRCEKSLVQAQKPPNPLAEVQSHYMSAARTEGLGKSGFQVRLGTGFGHPTHRIQRWLQKSAAVADPGPGGKKCSSAVGQHVHHTHALRNLCISSSLVCNWSWKREYPTALDCRDVCRDEFVSLIVEVFHAVSRGEGDKVHRGCRRHRLEAEPELLFRDTRE
jgi:hypothetical protein